MIEKQASDFLLRKRQKARPTYEQYRYALEGVLLPWCQQASITEARELDDTAMRLFTEYLRTGRERALSMASVQTYVRSVRIFLNWCKVPVGDYESVHVPHRMRDTLSRQEVEKIENAATNEAEKLMVRVLADTGIRVSELTGIRPRDLRADTHGKMYFIRVIGKGDKEREVGVPKETYQRLRQLSLKQSGDDWIFHLNDEKMEKYHIEYRIRTLAKKAGIGRRVFPHLLRHSFVTQQIRTGKASLIDIQRAVGHTTLAMVSQIYAHTTPADSYTSLMEGLK